MLKIVAINPSKRTLLLVDGLGRKKAIRNESKFIRHYHEMVLDNLKPIPDECLKDHKKLGNVDICDFDDFFILDIDVYEVCADGKHQKYSLAHGKIVNCRKVK